MRTASFLLIGLECWLDSEPILALDAWLLLFSSCALTLEGSTLSQAHERSSDGHRDLQRYMVLIPTYPAFVVLQDVSAQLAFSKMKGGMELALRVCSHYFYWCSDKVPVRSILKEKDGVASLHQRLQQVHGREHGSLHPGESGLGMWLSGQSA